MADDPSSRTAGPASHLPMAPLARRYGLHIVRGTGCWFSITYQKPRVFTEHRHRKLQVAVFLEGSHCAIRWGQSDGRRTELALQGSHVWIVPPGVTHGADWFASASLLIFYLEPAWAQHLVDRPVRNVSAEPLDRYLECEPLIGELAEFLTREEHQSSLANDRVLAHMGPAMASQLLLAHFAPCKASHPKQWQLPRTVLVDIRTYIREHLGDELSLPILARVAGLSPSYFGQLFRAATGVPPMVFVTGCRIRKAKALLRTGNYTIAEVAQISGFSDQHQMDYHFRQYLNNPPRAYQPRHKRRDFP